MNHKMSIAVTGISDVTFTNGIIDNIPNQYTYSQGIATVIPEGATNQTIIWSTNNSDIINITNAYTGTFMAQNYGTATITATTDDGSFSKSITMYVGVPAEGLSDIRDASGTIVTDYTQVLITDTTNVSAFVLPANAINTNRTWTSSDPDIAEINPINGYITAKALGTVTITVTTEGGQFSKSVICHVVDDILVTELTTSSLISDPDQSITIDGTTYININGLNYQSFNNYNSPSLNVYANPFNAIDRSLIYSCANTDVLTINSTGSMVAKPNFSLAAGAITNTTVTVTSVSNPSLSATYNVRVTNPDISSAFIHSSRTFLLGVGESTTLLELWSVADNAPLVTNGPVYFESSNTSVVSIQLIYDQPHVFTGVAEGSATITAYYENKVAKCTLYIRDQSTFVEVVSVDGKFLEPTSDSTVITSNPNESSFWTSDLQTINPITMYTVSPSTAPLIVEATLSRSDIISIDSSGVLTVVPKAPGVAYNTTDYTDVTVKIMKWNSYLTYTHKIRLDIVTTGYELNYVMNNNVFEFPANSSNIHIFMKQLQEGSDSIDVWSDFGSGSVMTNLGYTDEDVVWSSSDSLGLIFVNNGSGLITFVTVGTTWIRCIIGGKYIAEKQYTIFDPNQITGMSDIQLRDYTAYESSGGDVVTITDTSFNFGTITVIQASAQTLPIGSNQYITYTSSDTGVLQFRENKGVMTDIADVLGAGPVTITATSGSFSSTSTLTIINVFVAVTGIDSLKTAADESVSFNLYPEIPITLTATVHPADATDKTITWTTDNDQVATVVDGIVTYVGDGTCVITATTVDGSFNTSIICVASVPVASIADISAASTSIAPGSSLQLSSSISPFNATNSTINWAISNPIEGVTISSSGELSVAADVTSVTSITVTATAAGDSSKTTSKTISVYYAVSSVSSIVGAGAATSISPANSLQLSCTISPAYATNKDVSWSVDSAAAAAGITVSAGGLLEVPANVTTVTSIDVTATSADNGTKSASASFSVVYATTTISAITASKYTISPGETLAMSCTVGPSYATNKSVNWSVNVVSSIAAINSDGVLSLAADATGATSIIVTATADGNSTLIASKSVDIIVPVSSINAITTVAANGFSISANSSIQLACSVNPAGATNKKINWSINVTNPTIASISSTGLVTIGLVIPSTLTSITVTATADGDNTKVATESLVFPSAVQSLSLIGAPTSNMRPGATLQLICTTNPPTATNNTVNWSLNVAPSVATISSSGLLTLAADVMNVSSITVTATADADNTKTQTRPISIYYPVSSVNSITTSTGVNRVIPGTSLAVSTSVSPAHATDKGITWSIDVAPSIATISTSGILTIVNTSLPLSVTSIVATATAVGDNTKTNTLTIPVYYPVTSISIAATGGTTIPVNSSSTLVVTITPSYATNKTLTWTSTSASITLDTSSDSVIATGVTATTSQVGIIAASVDGPSRTINLNVGAIAVSGMTLETTGGVSSMLTGATLNMIATVSPPSASDKTVTWSLTSLPAGIATINQDGQISTLADTNGGTVTVTATPSNRAFAKLTTLRVSTPLTGFSTTIADFSAVLGVNNQRSISLTPSGAADRTFSTSITDLSGTNVATITNTSLIGITVVGNNIGSARITLTATADPSITTSFVITVTGTPVNKLNAVTLGPSGVKATAVENGASIALTSSTNADASNKNIIWTCEDSSIVVIPSGSNSSTNATSSCTVTCANSDYNKTKTITIIGTSQSNPTVVIRQNLTIKAAAKPKITITTTPTVNVKTLFVGNTLNLAASVANSRNEVTWSSNTPLLATVDAGIVTGLKAGSATIKASLSTDSKIFAVYAIKITNVVPLSISMSSTAVVVSNATSTGANGTVALSASNPRLIATVNPSNVTVPGVNWTVSPAGFATINADGQLTLIKVTTTGKPITVTAKTKGAPAKAFAVKLTITNA